MRERVAHAALRAGRAAAEVRLVAVSKGEGPQAVLEAYDAGHRDFGESRLEEALTKVEALSGKRDICWHMVGHIQSRKAADAVAHFVLVHSVDRLKIALRLNRFVGQLGRRLPVLLECNVSGETSKAGWLLKDQAVWESILPEFEQIVGLANLQVCGLMTMAPWKAENDTARSVFRRLRELRGFLETRLPGHWQELSMGMSDDFELAVEEGSTMLRVGRAIFGGAD